MSKDEVWVNACERWKRIVALVFASALMRVGFILPLHVA
jgi:hypothetical protein